MRRFGRVVLWTALAGCLIGAVVIALLVPWKEQTFSECLYCGARASELRILSVPFAFTVTEGDLARYWRNNVDAHHQHEWVPYARQASDARGGICADYAMKSPARQLFEDEQLVAILSSLPTATTRLAFMKWLVESGKVAHAGKRDDIASKLRTAYDKNPTRKDWPEVLRKLGCYPGTGAKSP